MKKQFCGCLTLLLACLVSTEVFSEDDCSWDGCDWRGDWEQGVLYAGGGVAFFDTDLRLGVRSLSTLLDLEDDAGLTESKGSFRAGGYYRLGRRHRFNLDYYEYNRDATKRLRAGITIRDRFIGIDELIDTSFNFRVIKGSYQFNAWKTDKVELGLLLGVYGATIETEVKSPRLGVSESIDSFVPMPNFGVRITNRLTDELSVSTSFQYFAAEINDWEGSLQEFWFGVEYNVWDNVGVGVGYDVVAGEVEKKDRKGRNGQFNLDFSSISLYLKAYF